MTALDKITTEKSERLHLIKQELALNIGGKNFDYTGSKRIQIHATEQFARKTHRDCLQCSSAQMDCERMSHVDMVKFRLRCNETRCKRAAWADGAPMVRAPWELDKDILADVYRNTVSSPEEFRKEFMQDFDHMSDANRYFVLNANQVEKAPHLPPPNPDIPSVEGAGAW